LTAETTLAVYLFVAVRNASLDRIKHDRVVQRQLDGTDSFDTPPGMGATPALPDRHIEQQDVTAAVWRAVETLPERARAIMVLRWREQQDWNAIAAALGMTVTAAQVQHTRALKQLREWLPGYLRDA
jgi:RNA polymerase sigma-70 factor (ECF subfamily)